MEREFKTWSEVGQEGSDGFKGVRIQVAGLDYPPGGDRGLDIALMRARDLVLEAITAYKNERDPEKIAAAAEQRSLLLQSFGDAFIFAEELPNGYCSRACCKMLPWFKVATGVGYFVIGWRKRVIHIDWSGTVDTGEAEDLFPMEETTKSETSIHAWSYEDAKRYIGTIIASADKEVE